MLYTKLEIERSLAIQRILSLSRLVHKQCGLNSVQAHQLREIYDVHSLVEMDLSDLLTISKSVQDLVISY